MDMREVDSASIDLIVSGPPYWSYIDYSAFHAARAPADFIWKPSVTYDQFLLVLGKWYTECLRVLRPGRYCVVNLGTVRRKGRCYPLPFDAVPIIEKLGFEFCYEILWHKVAGGRRHARVPIRWPYPGYYIPNNRVEYLLVFRKASGTAFLPKGRNGFRSADRFPIDDVFLREIANNVWHILPPHGRSVANHPCPFPPEIPYRLITLLSLKGETVLDPFIGVGTTARAATMLGRHYIGYEIEKPFARAALRSAHIPLKLRQPIICHYGAAANG